MQREDLFQEIKDLKRRRGAVLLAHYYQDAEVQEVADFLGDSLQLARAAQRVDAPVILFCGVHFMAETAKILNPARTVVLPDLSAGCSLADSCPPALFKAFLARHPRHQVVSYINCSAAVKALSDVICTSSNAEAVVRSFPPEQPLIFAPDRNLGRFVARRTGRELLLWQGTCVVHEAFSARKLTQLRVRHPEAKVLAHPECEEPVLAMADFIGSTTAILKRAVEGPEEEFIVATEPGILHEMQRQAPGKRFIPAPPDGSCACSECPHMRRNTLEKVRDALRDLAPRIEMDEALRLAALRPLQRMMELSG